MRSSNIAGFFAMAVLRIESIVPAGPKGMLKSSLSYERSAAPYQTNGDE